MTEAFRQGFENTVALLMQKNAGLLANLAEGYKESFSEHPVATSLATAATASIPALIALNVADRMKLKEAKKRLRTGLKGIRPGPYKHKDSGKDYYIKLQTGNVYDDPGFDKGHIVKDKAIEEYVQDMAIQDAANEFFRVAGLSDRLMDKYRDELQPYFNDNIYIM